MSTRFRIELEFVDQGWEARVFDLEDHGEDVMYASAWSPSIERAISQAAHYVLVAA